MTKFKYPFAVALVLASAQPSLSAPTCARYQDLMKILSTRYQEKISAYGLTKQQQKVEIFVSKNGTFTILATTTDGISCIIAAGDSWELELKNLASL